MFRLRSSAFIDGSQIPQRYSQEGKNFSPPLEWFDIPEGTLQLALVCEDPDAPGSVYTHWVIYSIDPRMTTLPEGVLAEAEPANVPHAKQGVNSAEKVGYVGPMPPRGHGWHRYFFKLYALRQKLDLPIGLTADELRGRMRTHVIAEAQTIGLYQRRSSSHKPTIQELRL